MMPPCCSGRGYGSSIICVPRFELRCGWCRPCCSGRGPEAVGSTVFCSRSQHCYQCENLRTHRSSIPSPPSVPVCSKAFPTTPSSTEILIGFSPAISFVFQGLSSDVDGAAPAVPEEGMAAVSFVFQGLGSDMDDAAPAIPEEGRRRSAALFPVAAANIVTNVKTFEHIDLQYLLHLWLLCVPRHFLLYLRAQKSSLGFLQQYHLCSKVWVPMWMMSPCCSGRGPEAAGGTVSCSCS